MARKPKSKSKADKLKADKLKQEKLEKQELAKLRAVEAPTFYASTFRVQGTGNDFGLIFQRAVTMQREDGAVHPDIASLGTVAIVNVSPQSLKDFHVLIGRTLENHEKEFGRIETPYTKRLAEQKP